MIVGKTTANVEKRAPCFRRPQARLSRVEREIAEDEQLTLPHRVTRRQKSFRKPSAHPKDWTGPDVYRIATVAQWLHSVVTDHRIYCGFPGRAGMPARAASRVAAVRRLLVVRAHVAEDLVQAVALDRHAPANKVVGFRVRERVA